MHMCYTYVTGFAKTHVHTSHTHKSLSYITAPQKVAHYVYYKSNNYYVHYKSSTLFPTLHLDTYVSCEKLFENKIYHYSLKQAIYQLSYFLES